MDLKIIVNFMSMIFLSIVLWKIIFQISNRLQNIIISLVKISKKIVSKKF